jgi:transposase
MKKFKLFIGIDVSKATLDIALTLDGDKGNMAHLKISNNEKGLERMIRWIKEQVTIDQADWLFGLEHTGVYIIRLCEFLEHKGFDYLIESALRLKNSLGIKRAKSDKTDAKDIAEYIYLRREKLTVSKLPDGNLMELQALYAQRRLLVKHKVSLSNSTKERSRFVSAQYAQTLLESTAPIIEMIEQNIKTLESRMKEIIQNDPTLKQQYKLITSVKGIGLINAVLFLVQTGKFTAFTNPRKYATHAGVAPFRQQSGTTLNRQPKVSYMANKHLKAMLTQAANTAVQHDRELKQYYHRKLEQGKNKFSVLNAVKNKLIHRVFAVVKRGTPYVELSTFT